MLQSGTFPYQENNKYTFQSTRIYLKTSYIVRGHNPASTQTQKIKLTILPASPIHFQSQFLAIYLRNDRSAFVAVFPKS